MMNTSHRPLRAGDYVRFRGTSSTNPPGMVTEVLADDYVRVRWPELPRATVHRAHSLAVASTPEAVADAPAADVDFVIEPESDQ